MNTFDIILGLLLVVGVIRGYSRGFFLEVTSLVGLGLGIYGAIHFSYFLGDYLKDRMDWDESMIQLVALAGTFLIILLALVFLGKALTKVADTIAEWRGDPRKSQITVRDLLNFTSGMETGFNEIYGRSSANKLKLALELDAIRDRGKSFIYGLVSFFFRYLEEVLPRIGDAGGFAAANAQVFDEIIWPHFWAVQILMMVTIVVFVCFTEIDRSLGEGRLRAMFFGGSAHTA